MECTSEKCKRKLVKRLYAINSSLNASSESSLSSDSDSYLHPLKCPANRNRRGAECSKRDYLSRLFESKKLKEKSLSRKLKTPFDRKLYRTCWPIELKKVSRIQKKPCEKKREKPTNKSLTRKNITNPLFISKYLSRERSPQITGSELEFLDDDSFSYVYQCTNNKQYVFEQVTPKMLIEVLRDPEYLKTGATIYMIIKKLKYLKLVTNAMLDHLKEDIFVKLHCAIKLGLLIENKGYYRIADNLQDDKFSKEKVNYLWNFWYSRMKKLRQ